MNIPTNKKFKSLNLSHSLIIVCSVLFNLLNKTKPSYKKSNKITLASKKQIQIMMDQCFGNLESINFFKPDEKKTIMQENLRNIFYRLELSEKEVRILSSLFANLIKNG